MKRGSKHRRHRDRTPDPLFEAPARRREPKFERAGFDLTASARLCDRCEMTFTEGYTWPALGIPLVLCRDCTEDIEASVESYGEPQKQREARLMTRLRSLGA